MKISRERLLFIIFLIFAHSLFAEQFRIGKTHILKISGNSVQEQTITIGINDGISLFLSEDTTYLEGIEVKVQIPNALSQWRDAVAVSLYDGIEPKPASSQIDYKGTKIYVTTLPTKLSWIFQIPIKKANSLKDSTYTTKSPVIPDTGKGFTFLRFQLAMKGLSEDAINSKLTITVKPLLINKGKLLISAKAPIEKNENKIKDGENEKQETALSPDIYISEKNLKEIDNFEVFIDDIQMPSNTKSFILSPGMHNVSIHSDEYKTEVMSFFIERAKTTNADFILKSLVPTLRITAPNNAQIFLDSEEIKTLNEEITINEGEHNIRCLIGGYELLRTIDIQKGKSYTANLSIDLEITED